MAKKKMNPKKAKAMAKKPVKAKKAKKARKGGAVADFPHQRERY